MNAEWLIIGVGNDYRGDDAAGLIAVRRIKELNLPNVRVIESDGEFTKLMEGWRGAEKVILIDAVQSGAAPGTLHRFAAHEKKLPANLLQCSTHAFGVAEAIEMSKALGQLPGCFIVLGIECQGFITGTNLSAVITTAIEKVVTLIAAIIRERDAELRRERQQCR